MTDLSSYLNGRTKSFSGRGWVFDRIGTWLDDPAGARVFLLTGRPGTGKTAIAARVAQMNAGEVPAAHPALARDRFAFAHFCQAGVESTLSPVSFVRSLSESLGNRYPPFREALQNSGSRQIVINAVQNFTTGSDNTGVRITVELRSSDARPLFDEAVRRPLQALAATLGPGQRIAVLIDSLDEALTFSADSSIPHLLKLANDFPPQVRFLLTCRTTASASSIWSARGHSICWRMFQPISTRSSPMSGRNWHRCQSPIALPPRRVSLRRARGTFSTPTMWSRICVPAARGSRMPIRTSCPTPWKASIGSISSASSGRIARAGMTRIVRCSARSRSHAVKG